MIKFKRLTIALLALLSVSATAWADGEVYDSSVNISTLQVGDILIEGAQITISDPTHGLEFMKGRYFLNDATTPNQSNFLCDQTATVGANGLMTGLNYGAKTRPADAEGKEGNAWEVTAVTANSTQIVGITYAPNSPAAETVDVTLNEAKTEATFEMPQYDVTVTYSLKRDMTVDMAVTVQDAEQNSRFRVQKQGNSFVPVGLTNEQVMALFTVHDDIEEKDLTAATDYTVQIFAVDDEGQPTGQPMTFQNFTYAPGNYVVKAVAVEGSNYSGETALSNVFVLFQGYELSIPAGEYATYYKEEALYVEDADAQLYTITAVNGDKATATELTTAAANTPLLVKNNASEAKTILLIPTTERTPDNVTVYNGFVGTLEATQIAASTDAQNNYAFNGLQFVWVKTAINIGANKCWLAVPVTGVSSARTLTIVFDSEATGITNTNFTNSTNGDWYDINGRKLQGIPTRKGVYIVNGKKVVVR